MEDPLILFAREGGMASHGGLSGLHRHFVVRPIFQAIPFAHRRHDRQRRATRLFFGRIATINGELWGGPRRFPDLLPRLRFLEGVARHPRTLRRDTRRLCTLFSFNGVLEIRVTRRAWAD